MPNPDVLLLARIGWRAVERAVVWIQGSRTCSKTGSELSNHCEPLGDPYRHIIVRLFDGTRYLSFGLFLLAVTPIYNQCY